MKSKYNMSVQDNIFFAKRKEIDNVYCSAILENIKKWIYTNAIDGV